jgi:uncharacterized caspase-like protein
VKRTLLLLFGVCLLFVANAQTRSSSVDLNLPTGEKVTLYKASYALVIGNSLYRNGWPVLPGVRKDVELVKVALEKNGFVVTMLMDLDKQQMDAAFTDFINKYGNAPENRLLVYFAGHGHTMKTSYGEMLGYVVPVDAPNPNKDNAGFMSKAVEMQQIEIYSKRIQSKHALFLFDACFSGSLFAVSRAVPEIISYKTQNPVRQYITSGSADETVPDESIFRAQFIRALEGDGDANTDGFMTGTELGEYIQSSVTNYSKNSQHPQYGKIRNPNLDKGDFVFLVGTPKLNNNPQQPSQQPATQTAAAPRDLGTGAAVPPAAPNPQVYSSMLSLFSKTILTEEFDNNDNGWTQVEAKYGNAAVENGTYTIKSKEPYYGKGGFNGQLFTMVLDNTGLPSINPENDFLVEYEFSDYIPYANGSKLGFIFGMNNSRYYGVVLSLRKDGHTFISGESRYKPELSYTFKCSANSEDIRKVSIIKSKGKFYVYFNQELVYTYNITAPVGEKLAFAMYDYMDVRIDKVTIRQDKL